MGIVLMKYGTIALLLAGGIKFAYNKMPKLVQDAVKIEMTAVADTTKAMQEAIDGNTAKLNDVILN